MTEGESARVLVVRTDNRGTSSPVAGAACERHMLAPRASVRTLELHGILDLPGQHRPDPNAYRLLASRDTRAAVVSQRHAGRAAGGTPYVDTDKRRAGPGCPIRSRTASACGGCPAPPS